MMLAIAMVSLAITHRHATTGPDRFLLVGAVVLALLHATLAVQGHRKRHAE